MRGASSVGVSRSGQKFTCVMAEYYMPHETRKTGAKHFRVLFRRFSRNVDSTFSAPCIPEILYRTVLPR
ncbi:hypothetical protein Y032_0466g1983 [Ancylostoma ceylanicum]|nr:hypothetical protein Y032_0466g1983 [Ancylostoma ceylanicum]